MGGFRWGKKRKCQFLDWEAEGLDVFNELCGIPSTDFNLLWVTMTAENKSISHVIWDWNGTLVDDSEFCASVVSAVLEEWNLPVIDRLAYRRQFRFPVREFYEELGFSGGDSDYLRVCDSFIKKYRAGWRNCSLQNGAMEVLSTLQKKGRAADHAFCWLSKRCRGESKAFQN